MLSKIKVYGRLARFLGERSFEAEISTPLHAFKFLLANFPHLERHMMEQNYCVKVGKDEIDETELFDPIGQQEIKIVPVVTGSRGFTRVLAGVALIGAAILAPGAAPAFGLGGFTAGTAGASLLTVAAANFGAYLILSGTAQMLTPVPQPPGVSEDPQSQNFSFSGVQNTSRAGTAIPVIYGEIFAGSLVVSAGIDTVQIKGTA
jgi:predicted phage tail protein